MTATTTTIMESIQKRSNSFLPLRPCKDDLPISQPPSSNQATTCLRRRLSSLSLNLNIGRPLPATFRRSFSTPNLPFKSWWDWGLSWFLSIKPSFARGVDMDDEESAVLGIHSRGSWRHLLYRVRSEFKRMVPTP